MPRRLVLVVDDDMDVRDAYAEALREAGYDAIAFTDGRMALDYLRTGPAPDVILLDVVMPGMDGFTFHSTQLSDPRWSAIPTVVITADRKVSQRWLDAHVETFLTKPVPVEALLRAVHEAVENNHRDPGRSAHDQEWTGADVREP